VNPVAPWHMWGNTIRVSLPLVAPPAPRTIGSVENVQVAKVEYRRPETWSFFLAGRIINGVTSDVDRILIAQLNLYLGVGRSIFLAKGLLPSAGVGQQAFATFRWDIPAGTVPTETTNASRWTTSVTSPALDDSVATSTHDITWFPSENIQVDASAQLTVANGSLLDNSIDIELTAYFAPRTHVRPDWFSDDDSVPQFPGGEVKGS
jgi:hypothetical protein